MRKLTAPRLAVLFAGCFLGAGFVSGRELWQYFGAYGWHGMAGMVLAILLSAGFSYLVFYTAKESGQTDADRLVIFWNQPLLRGLILIVQLLILFSIVVVMTAGIGALFTQLFAVPTWLGCAGFSLLMLLLAMFGRRGMVSVFAFAVPVLSAAAVAFGLYEAFCGAALGFSEASQTGTAILGNWLISAINYAAYNSFATIAILAPFTPRSFSRQTMLIGLALGSTALLFVAVGIMLTVLACPGAEEQELPMIYAAAAIGQKIAYGYAGLLFLGMFGTALSSFVSAEKYMEEKLPLLKNYTKLFSVLFCIVSFVASLIGFGDLIGVLYPAFGYIGCAAMICLMIHAGKYKFQRRKR